MTRHCPAVIVLSLLAAACGAGTPTTPSSNAAATPPASEPVVIPDPVDHIDVNGSSIDVRLKDAVTSVRVTENGLPAGARVSTYTNDSQGIGADPSVARYWRLGVAFDHAYMVHVVYRGRDFEKGPYTPRENVCGGCANPPSQTPPSTPTPPPPAPPPTAPPCVLNQSTVTWVPPDVAIRINRETATVPAGCAAGLYYVSWGITDIGEWHRFPIALFEEGGVSLTATWAGVYTSWFVELRDRNGVVVSTVEGTTR
jgi:hypothetical protein